MFTDSSARFAQTVLVAVFPALLIGCAAGVTGDEEPTAPDVQWGAGGTGGAGGNGAGAGEGGIGGDWLAGGGSSGSELSCGEGELTATVRDFSQAHPDFEQYLGDDAFLGLVQAELAPDGTPAYAHSSSTQQTTGPAEFAHWYHDTPGINEALTVTLTLTEVSVDKHVYDNPAFFPADGQGLGNEGYPHNFHFTTEIHTSFYYAGGETFTFTGDDDLWLFINGRLAIDLGGLHPKLSRTVALDSAAAELDIEPGNVYSMDIFHAERHSPESNFHIETSITCFDPVPK